MFNIGNIRISAPLVLAPMAGITDLPFRSLARSFGCELAFLEMISARSIVYQAGRTNRMLTSSAEDRPLGVQLLGNESTYVLAALEKIRHLGFDIVDLNAACPVEKVTRKGKGSSLLKDPLRLRELLAALVKNAGVPVTVKIRAGWDSDSINAREVALHAEDAGVSALTIHGRTRMQGYGGRVDYDIIRRVKEALSIPLIASGDALSPQLIRRMFDETGCDAVAVARGSLGNPWIFRDTVSYLEKGIIPERPGPDEIADIMLRHLDLNCGFYGEKKGTVLFRKLFAWYVKGLEDVRSMKEEAFKAETKEDMKRLIEASRSHVYRHSEGNYDGYSADCCSGGVVI